MKSAPVIALCLLACGPAFSQDVGGIGELNGEKVLLMPDYTWRYDDSGGERCTAVTGRFEVCALPSEWAPKSSEPVPDENGLRNIWFHRGAEFRAAIWVMGDPTKGIVPTDASITNFINVRRGKDSDFGLTPEDTKATIGDTKPNTLSSVIGTKTTQVFSLFAMPDGNAFLVETIEEPTFLYSVGHRAAHESFINAIRLEAGQ